MPQGHPDNATTLESSRAPADPTAAAGQRAGGFCTVRECNYMKSIHREQGTGVHSNYFFELSLRAMGFCIVLRRVLSTG